MKNILFLFFLTALLFIPLLAFGAEETQVYHSPKTVEITGEFTDNPFSQVVNGQKNIVKLTFDNKGETNYTIVMVTGALVNKDNPTEIYRNLTGYKYTTPAPSMDHIDFIYHFYAEFPPQELGLLLHVYFTDEEGKNYKGVGYDGTVTVVNPEVSIFDLQVIFMYAILIGFFGGIGYLIYQAFFGGTKPKGKRRPAKTEDTATESSDKYDESWIPEHHLKPQQTRSSARIRKKNEAKKE